MYGRLALIKTVFSFEFRSALRDRNTVIYSIVIPFALYPGMIWAIAQWSNFQAGSLEKMESRVAVSGGDLLPELVERIAAADRIEVVEAPEPDSAIKSGDLDAHAAISAGIDGPVLTLFYDLARDRSATAKDRLGRLATEYSDDVLAARLSDVGRNARFLDVLDLEEENVASSEEMGRFLLSSVLPIMMVLMVATGAMNPAVDILTGEKERKTVESILAAGTDRVSLLGGKLLVVMSLGFVALLLNLAGMLLALEHLLTLSPGASNIEISISMKSIPIILLSGLLLSLLIASVMTVLASFAKTFREGQSYVTPFYILMTIPAFVASREGMELDMSTAFIPVANVILLMRGAFSGSVPVLPAITSLVALAVYAVAAVLVSHKVFADEQLLLGTGSRTLRSLPRILAAGREDVG